MMARWLIFLVASGQAFFIGIACLLAAIAISAWSKGKGLRTARNFLVSIGASLVVASATPLSTISSAVITAASVLWLAVEVIDRRSAARARPTLRVVAGVVWLVAVAGELPFHLPPHLPPLGNPTIGIIGDSLTAGIDGPASTTWPGLLASRHGIAVRDHAVAGGTLASALKQARQVDPEERLVLLEIGGNDLLSGAPPGQFAVDLDALLTAVCRPGRVVLIFELPLPPTYQAYGAAQRHQARRHGVSLIPKRVLLGVLQSQGSTLDTVHLSASGHSAMADSTWRAVRQAFRGE